jgi:hypothetical protein
MLPNGTEFFAGDLSDEDQKLVWATHIAPVFDLFHQQKLSADNIAWRSKPSWYVLATQDHTVRETAGHGGLPFLVHVAGLRRQLLAQSGHEDGAQRLPLSGVKRTPNVDYLMSSIDPERKLHCAPSCGAAFSLRYLRLPPGCTNHAKAGPHQGSLYALTT